MVRPSINPLLSREQPPWNATVVVVATTTATTKKKNKKLLLLAAIVDFRIFSPPFEFRPQKKSTFRGQIRHVPP